MHSYSIDSEIRRAVYVTLGVISFALPLWLEEARTLFGIPQEIGYPLSFGVTFAILHLAFDRWAWKLLTKVSLLPNLNGTWEVNGASSYQNGASFSGKVTIRQTFSAIEIFGEFEASTSRSTLAGFCLNHAVPIFRYAFENTPKSLADPELQRHPGLIELRIGPDDEMRGDYFSGKHRLRYGEMILRRTQ
jgi:hypothetical protein